MNWTPAEIGDLTGTRAVVTGANSGIGAVHARVLAEHGAEVTLAVRNVDAGQQVAATLPGRTRVEPLDLASLASVRAFADRWKGPLDLLVNNAGVMAPPRRRETEDGFELQFGTNHLGHFALTGLLLPRLLAAPLPRVTTVASLAHRGGNADVLQGNPAQGYNPSTSYSQSKLANLLFALELHRRAGATGSPLVSNAAHPGVTNTGLFVDAEGLGSIGIVRRLGPPIMGLLVPPAERGAEAILYAATVGSSGQYFGPQRLRESRGPVGQARMSPFAADAQLAAALWRRSEELTGVTFAF
ncbi:MAG: SDR family NAD(P)-dependent oxidoreductase [Tetrasphaera sp.]|nr:SDR family NAD(P)-dependent oxidoreductase [Tetrasphaera sp.]